MYRSKQFIVSMLTLILGFSLLCTPVLATSTEPNVSGQGQSQANAGDTPSVPNNSTPEQSSSAPPSSTPPKQEASSSVPTTTSVSSSVSSSAVTSSRTSSSKASKKKKVSSSSQVSSLSSSEDSSSEFGTGVSNVSSSSTISLPPVSAVSEANKIIASGVEVQTQKSMNWWGIVSWALIGLGILIVIIVLLSTLRRPPPGGPGRKRYRRHPFPTKKKRLLNDKYYRNKY